MISAESKAAPDIREPMECLLRIAPGELNAMMVYRLVAKGLDLIGVENMLSKSDQRSVEKVMSPISCPKRFAMKRSSCCGIISANLT